MTNNGPENKANRTAKPRALGPNKETNKFLQGMGKSRAPGWGDQSFTGLRNADASNTADTSGKKRARALDEVNRKMDELKNRVGTKQPGEARSSRNPNAS